jgi:NAD(P)-dependent dehydrogenase (short-subunit alcohol dehydrogenase family)
MAAIADVIFAPCVAALPDLFGKTVAITGSTSGTGYFCAQAAIEKGAHLVLLLNRPSERATESGATLSAMVQSSSAEVATMVQQVPCDLQSFASVRNAAEKMNKLLCNVFGGLDVLVNNAGVMGVPDTRTADGYDVQMQTNHLSHFLLTNLLTPSLEMAVETRGEARVVQHSSGARSKDRAVDGVGNLERQYLEPSAPGALGGDSLAACFNRYHQTKLSNPVFMLALHERLKAAGSGIKSVCAEPGVAATALVANLQTGHEEAGNDLGGAMSAMTYTPQSAADGAAPLIEAAFGQDVESGDFFMPGDLINNTVVGMPVKCMTGGKPTPSSEFIASKFENEQLTMHPPNREVLWEASEAAVGAWGAVAPAPSAAERAKL